VKIEQIPEISSKKAAVKKFITLLVETAKKSGKKAIVIQPSGKR
jgi:hypothetical protein